MSRIVHTSRIQIYQDKRPVRRAFFDGFREPVYFGVHGGIKEFYGLEPEVEYPATLDYIVAGVGG